MLQEACVKAGSQRAWAKAHSVSEAYVSDVLSGRREMGESIAAALSLERVVTYRLTEPTSNPRRRG